MLDGKMAENETRDAQVCYFALALRERIYMGHNPMTLSISVCICNLVCLCALERTPGKGSQHDARARARRSPRPRRAATGTQRPQLALYGLYQVDTLAKRAGLNLSPPMFR